MLILAVVAIRAVTGDGIIAHAKNARDNYNKAQIEENGVLKGYEDYITGQIGGSNGGGDDPVTPGGDTTPTIASTHLNTVLSTTANTKLKDKYGNPITVPAGFKIVVDNGTDTSKSTNYTADTIDVTKGIVVEDGVGNQFVWIPVGNIKTSTTDTVGTPITLGRYSWSGSTGTLEQPKSEEGKAVTDEVAIASGNNYTEKQPTSPTSNAKARNINDFYTSASTNKGYFLGRFEAGVSGYDETATNNNTEPSGETNWTKYTTADGKVPQLVCKSNQQVWDYVTQKKASELSQSMYTNKPYESDLINSYAWDTAIMFIQTFGTEEDASSYASENKCTGLRKTGLNPDKYCNIYDMSGNATEWTTETCDSDLGPCTTRGGCYDTGYPTFGSPSGTTAVRWWGALSDTIISHSFRPLLYMSLEP